MELAIVTSRGLCSLSKSPETVPNELEMALRISLGARLGDPDNWVFQTVSRKNNRSVLQVTQKSSGRRFALKFNDSRRKCRDQFRALEAMGKAGLSCVRPLFFDSKGKYLLMDWVDAPLLVKELETERRESLLYNSGRWLADLQRTTVGSAGLFSRTHRLQVPKIDGSEAIKEAATRLKRRSFEVKSPRRRLVRLHGDYHVRNAFCTSDRLIVFDPQVDSFGHPFVDVARFLVSAALHRHVAEEVGQRWPGDAKTDRLLFLRGYGAVNSETSKECDFFEDYTYLSVLLRIRRRAPNSLRCRFLEQELRARGVL